MKSIHPYHYKVFLHYRWYQFVIKIIISDIFWFTIINNPTFKGSIILLEILTHCKFVTFNRSSFNNETFFWLVSCSMLPVQFSFNKNNLRILSRNLKKIDCYDFISHEIHVRKILLWCSDCLVIIRKRQFQPYLMFTLFLDCI